MLRRARELAARRANFALESTLSGRTLHRFLNRVASVGYERHVFYLWLPSPDMAVARVRGRVKAGGHDVPEHVIRRRFGKSLVNFDKLYRPDATTWRLYDGGALAGRPLIAHGAARHKAVVVDEERWALVARQIQEADR